LENVRVFVYNDIANKPFPAPVVQVLLPALSTRSERPKLLAFPSAGSVEKVARISSASPVMCGRYPTAPVLAAVPLGGSILIGPAFMGFSERNGSKVPTAGSCTMEAPLTVTVRMRECADCQ
jgi:hypothetical protein